MELEEAIKTMGKFLKDTPKLPYDCIANQEIIAVETIINHITKQEKMIEYMVNWINDHEDPFEGCHENGKCENELISCEECIKQYFEKKAEESE